MFVWAKEKPRKASVQVRLLKKTLPELIVGFVYLVSSVNHILMEKQ